MAQRVAPRKVEPGESILVPTGESTRIINRPEEIPKPDWALMKSIVEKIGGFGSRSNIDGFSEEEWALLRRRGIVEMEAVPFGRLNSSEVKIADYLSGETHPNFFLHVKLDDGTSCAMMQPAFRDVLVQPGGLLSFKTFEIHGEPKYREHIKEPFGANIVLHIIKGCNTAAWMNGYIIESDASLCIPKSQFAAENVGEWTIALIELPHQSFFERLKGPPIFRNAGRGPHHRIDWGCILPSVEDADVRPAIAQVEIAVGKEDFERIKDILNRDSMKIREIMTGLFPELQALVGMGAVFNGNITVPDELKASRQK